MTHGTRNITRKCTMLSRWPTVTLESANRAYFSKLCSESSFIAPKVSILFGREREREREGYWKERLSRGKGKADSVAKEASDGLRRRGGGSGLFEDAARILMQAVFDSARQTAPRQKLSASQFRNPSRREYSRHLALDPILMADKCRRRCARRSERARERFARSFSPS